MSQAPTLNTSVHTWGGINVFSIFTRLQRTLPFAVLGFASHEKYLHTTVSFTFDQDYKHDVVKNFKV